MDIEKTRKRNLTLLESQYDQKQDLADALGITPSYLAQLKGKSRPFNEKTAAKFTAKLKLQRDWFDIERDTILRVDTESQDEDVLIKPYQGPTAQGPATDKELVEMLSEPVKQSWLDTHGYKADKLVTVHYSLSKMSPLYIAGDRLVVNTEFDGSYKNNSIYVFKDDDGNPILWKVHNRRGGAIMLSCEDKDEYPDEIVPATEVHALDVVGVIVRLVRGPNI